MQQIGYAAGYILAARRATVQVIEALLSVNDLYELESSEREMLMEGRLSTRVIRSDIQSDIEIPTQVDGLELTIEDRFDVCRDGFVDWRLVNVPGFEGLYLKISHAGPDVIGDSDDDCNVEVRTFVTPGEFQAECCGHIAGLLDSFLAQARQAWQSSAIRSQSVEELVQRVAGRSGVEVRKCGPAILRALGPMFAAGAQV